MTQHRLPTIDRYRFCQSCQSLLKKTIAKQFSEYFKENKLFNQNQYGFRPGHSTELAALELVNKITSQMDNSETPINIFLDISKAFDSIDHNTA